MWWKHFEINEGQLPFAVARYKWGKKLGNIVQVPEDCCVYVCEYLYGISQIWFEFSGKHTKLKENGI